MSAVGGRNPLITWPPRKTAISLDPCPLVTASRGRLRRGDLSRTRGGFTHSQYVVEATSAFWLLQPYRCARLKGGTISAVNVFAIGVRLLALFMAIHAIAYLSVIGYFLSHLLGEDAARHWPNAVSQGLAFVLSLLAAFLLYRYAEPMARKFAPADEAPGHPQGGVASGRETFCLALKIIGGVCIAFSVPNIVGQGILRIMVTQSLESLLWSQSVPGVVALLFGLYLLKDGRILVDIAYGKDGDEPDSE